METIIYKVLKKFGDFKKGDTFKLDEVEMTEEEVAELVEAGKIEAMEDADSSDDEDDSDTGSTGTGKVTIVLSNRNTRDGQSTRVFDEATHGADFAKVADEFAETNKHLVISRTDE